MNNLVKYEKVNSANFKDLPDVFNNNETKMRALKTVGIHQEQVDHSLLKSTFLKKLLLNSLSITFYSYLNYMFINPWTRNS